MCDDLDTFSEYYYIEVDMLNDNIDILIIGAGRSGVSVAKYLAAAEKNAILTDIKTYKELCKDGYGIEDVAKLKRIKTIFGRQPSPEEVIRCGLVVLSPGVPPDIAPLQTARENGIRVVSEIEFANSLYKGNIIAITGTNGKTTTTTLLGELLKASGFDAYTAGNIGDPFINYVDKSEESVLALEIGSFQLEETEGLHPKIAIITNITPDHLDRHLTMENYIKAKAKIFKEMDINDFLILNMDDENVRKLGNDAKCNVLYFTVTNDSSADAYLSSNTIILKIDDRQIELVDRKEMRLMGLHNCTNVMCAALAAIKYGAAPEIIAETVKTFEPVEHRVEFVAEKNGIKYINDSKGTNPEATMTAINAIEDGEIVLILGGYDKHSEFDELFELIKNRVRHCVILGETKEKILHAAENAGYTEMTMVDDYEHAVKRCAKIAGKGEYVLLSPACASWDMFENYEQRGKYFKELVLSLT